VGAWTIFGVGVLVTLLVAAYVVLLVLASRDDLRSH
jgi:hypothetical protein